MTKFCLFNFLRPGNPDGSTTKWREVLLKVSRDIIQVIFYQTKGVFKGLKYSCHVFMEGQMKCHIDGGGGLKLAKKCNVLLKQSLPSLLKK